MDAISQAHSARIAAATILARFPDAATLRIGENVDGESQYDPLAIRDAHGAVNADADQDDEWLYVEMVHGGPNIQEIVWDLDPRNDRWAEGIATIDRGRMRYEGKHVDIDLRAALAAPLHQSAMQSSPFTRSFSEEEQRALVDVSIYGLRALEDSLEEADDPKHRGKLEDLHRQATSLIAFPKAQ